MFSTAHQCEDAQVRTNLIRCVGMLGMFFAKSAADVSQRRLKVRSHLGICESQGQLGFFYVGVLTVLHKLLRNRSTLQTTGQTFFIMVVAPLLEHQFMYNNYCVFKPYEAPRF